MLYRYPLCIHKQYDNSYLHGTVGQEYFDVIKVTWAKCSKSFNFVNLVFIQNLFNFYTYV